MDRLNEELRTQAIRNGLCAIWTTDWESDKTPQELIDMYKKGIDFSLLHDWPSNEFIKANFDRELLNRNLIFVDQEIDLMDAPSGVYVINGRCRGVISFSRWAAATVYIRHESDIVVLADGHAKVFVRLYDDAVADAMGLEDAVVKVYDRRNKQTDSET